MCARQRLPAEERKKQIRNAAKKVFLRNGFKDTTMEDVISEVGMSKGGVYKYYKSTSEMLYDIMVDGNINRNNMIEEFLSKNSEMDIEKAAVEITLMKMLDKAEYKPFYTMFLIEAQKNPRLKELEIKLRENYKKEFFEFIEKRNLSQLSFLFSEEWIGLINSIIVATEVLDVRDAFLDHKDLFRDIIKSYIEKSKSK